MSIEKKPHHSKATKIVLFWSNWLLILFLGRRFIGPLGDDVDFLLKNLGTFAVAIIPTAVMVRYLKGKVVKIAIIGIWIGTFLVAVI